MKLLRFHIQVGQIWFNWNFSFKQE